MLHLHGEFFTLKFGMVENLERESCCKGRALNKGLKMITEKVSGGRRRKREGADLDLCGEIDNGERLRIERRKHIQSFSL